MLWGHILTRACAATFMHGTQRLELNVAVYGWVTTIALALPGLSLPFRVVRLCLHEQSYIEVVF